MKRVLVRRGVTRTVFLTCRWAVKVPGGYGGMLVRGWLANRSEWRQRHRRRVCRPVLSLLHFVLVMPRAQHVGWIDDSQQTGPWDGCRGDKAKPSSWGWFGDRYLLIDYDLSWRVDRGIIGGIYFGWQEWRYGGADLCPTMLRFLERYRP